MEVFATFGLIVLVGLAIPILLLFSALVFDLAVVIYVLIASIGSWRRKPRIFGAVPRSGEERQRQRPVVVWAH